MNKIIPFNKDIVFDDTIGEIESIALDDVLKFEEKDLIKGELIIRGCNKYQDIVNDFSYSLPVLITIDNKYDTTKATIGIDDFYYEVINDNTLKVKIDLIIDNLYYEEESRNLNFDLDVSKEDDLIKGDLSLQKDSFNVDISLEKKDDEPAVDDLFKEEETEYSIYRVYIVNDNDSLDSILDKYKVSREELEKYNDLSNIKSGVKLIIPSIDE